MSLTISRWEELAPPPDCPEALGRAESDYGPEPRRGRLGASLAYALRVERRATSRSGGPEHLGREPEQVARAVARLLVTTVAAVGLMFLASALPARAASATTQGHAVPLQTPAGGEFLSPSGNISCEVDDGYAGLHQVYCQRSPRPNLSRCRHAACSKNAQARDAWGTRRSRAHPPLRQLDRCGAVPVPFGHRRGHVYGLR